MRTTILHLLCDFDVKSWFSILPCITPVVTGSVSPCILRVTGLEDLSHMLRVWDFGICFCQQHPPRHAHHEFTLWMRFRDENRIFDFTVYVPCAQRAGSIMYAFKGWLERFIVYPSHVESWKIISPGMSPTPCASPLHVYPASGNFIRNKYFKIIHYLVISFCS